MWIDTAGVGPAPRRPGSRRTREGIVRADSVNDWHARAASTPLDGRAVIGGRRVASITGETFACVSPIDGRP